MKYKILFIVVWVISLAALTNARGGTELQRATAEDNTAQAYSQRDFFVPLNNEVEMHLCYDFFVPGKTHKIKFVVALPKTKDLTKQFIGLSTRITPIQEDLRSIVLRQGRTRQGACQRGPQEGERQTEEEVGCPA